MIARTRTSHSLVRFLLSTVMIAAPIGLVGCQPEGTGSVKGPATRGSDDALGRPFGNAPEVPKKKPAVDKNKKEVVQPANPRL